MKLQENSPRFEKNNTQETNRGILWFTFLVWNGYLCELLLWTCRISSTSNNVTKYKERKWQNQSHFEPTGQTRKLKNSGATILFVLFSKVLEWWDRRFFRPSKLPLTCHTCACLLLANEGIHFSRPYYFLSPFQDTLHSSSFSSSTAVCYTETIFGAD